MSRCAATAMSAACVALALCGCARHTPTAAMERPVLSAEMPASQGPTFLERYQEMTRACNLEKARAGALAAELAETRHTLSRAEVELDKLRKDSGVLEMKARELETLRAQNEATQKANLDLDRTVRVLRRELLEEKLTSARHEQTILSLKIERAVERRRLAGEKPVDTKAAPATAKAEGGGHAATH